MYVFKNKYFLIIENTKDINLRNIKLANKFIIIYRNTGKKQNIDALFKFRRNCKLKKIDFIVSNDYKLMVLLDADGLYISAFNKDLRLSRFRRSKYKIIGSIHNIKDLNLKISQGCTCFLYSRLFKVDYKNKKTFLGITKFNLFKLNRKENIVPLGGIRVSNLNKLNLVKTNAMALLSEIKKKPAKIFSRLF